MHQNKHTDLTYLYELSNGSKEFILQMISVFAGSIPRMIQDMESSLSSGNWVALKLTAHKMKPSISLMGIHELESDIALIEESAAKEIRLDQIPEILNRVRVISFLAIRELEQEKEHIS